MLFSLEKKNCKKILLQKDSQKQCTIFRKKRGWIREWRRWKIFSSTEVTQSMCLQNELLLTAIVFSQAIIGQEIFWTLHSSNVLKKSGTIPIHLWRMLMTNVLPGDGCNVRTALRRKCNGCRQEPRFKRRVRQVHDIIISWATQNTPGNCPLSDEYPPGPSELLSVTLGHCSIFTNDFFFPFMLLRLHCHKLIPWHMWPVLSTHLQFSQNPTRHVLLPQLSFSLNPFCLTATLGDNLTLWVWAWAFHGYDFSLCSIISFLGVGTSRWRLSAQAKRLARSGRLHVRGVRACVHALLPPKQRLIPSRSQLWQRHSSGSRSSSATIFQILPWASPSEHSQK